MAPLPRKFVALSVGALYTALALASHGLHEWIGCDHEHEKPARVCEATDCCVGCHHAGGEPAAPCHEARQAFRTAGKGHDATACSVCALVAKLKTSHAAALVQVTALRTIAASLPASDPSAPMLSYGPLSARGPPALPA